MKKLITIYIALTIAILSNSALANFTAIGDPVTEGSWSTRFRENGIYGGIQYSFDLLGTYVFSGPPMGHPALSSFSVVGWDHLYENSTLTMVSASGPTVKYVEWNYLFSGAKSEPFMLYCTAFNGDTRIGTCTAYWSGLGWTYGEPADDWQPTRADFMIPAPGAILLGGIGVGLVGWLRRRRTL